ncbi:MAG: hypothetical protein ACXAEU_19600 [Candidatus Hodarchaeales archaeon]|jgi:hypothetical protein
MNEQFSERSSKKPLFTRGNVTLLIIVGSFLFVTGLMLHDSQPDTSIGSMGLMLELLGGWIIISWLIISPFVYCQSRGRNH